MWGDKISFKKKLVLSFFLFYMLPLILVVSVGFGLITNLLKEQGAEYYRRMFSTTVDRIDNIFFSMQEFNITMQKRSWVTSMIYMEDLEKSRFDRVDFTNFAEELRGFSCQDAAIDHLFYFFLVSDQFISTTDRGIVDYQWFTEVSFKNALMQQEDYHKLAAELKKPEYHILAVDNYGRKREGILCCYPVKELRGQSICNLYFFVQINELEQLLDLAMPEENNWFYMEYDVEILLNRTPYTKEELLGFDMEELGRNKTKMTGFTQESEKTGFHYYTLVSEDSVYARAKNMQVILLTLAGVFALAGFFLSYYMAIRNYRPVQNLMKLIKDKVPSEEVNRNEFFWLENAVGTILDGRKNLDIQIEEQRPILISAFLTWLLKENYKPEESKILHTAGMLGIEFGLPVYNCLLCSLKAGNRLNKEIVEILGEYKIHFRTLVYQNDYVVILNYEEEEEAAAFYKSMADMLNEKAEKYFFGVGESCMSIVQLPAVYTQAKQARNFRMVNRECGITFYNEVKKENFYFYPIENEYALRNCLLAGEYEKSVLIFNELLQKNLENEQVSYYQMRNFFHNVELTCLKCTVRLDIAGLIDSDVESLDQCNALEEYLSIFYNIFRKLCDYVNAHRESSSEVMKEALYQFVDENLCNSDLSLNFVANAFSLSDSYVSRLFKEKTGTNFLDYMNRARIEKAKMILLSESQTSIQDIGIRVGYDSDTTFRRIFKKYEGITPTQFRKI